MDCLHLRDTSDKTVVGEIKNVINELPVFNSCPPPLFNQDQEFCCYGWDLRPFCCDTGTVILNW